MIKTPKSIAVVGGGTAGFVSALILKKKFPSLKISIIRSSKIGIIGVGEGSTEHWKNFLNFIDIDFKEVLKECDSTLKCGIRFSNWTDKDYLHSIQVEYNYKFGQYSHVYANLIGRGCESTDMSSGLSWKNQVNRWYIDHQDHCPTSQFHFNTNRLNTWLTNLAIKFGIDIHDDEIVDFEITEDGSIGTLTGNRKKYNYDFYIDSTGFKKLLISKLGAKWQSYSKYLKMKSAIVFPTGDEENYNNYTLSRAMDYGWMFRIPVWGRYGNGYIYDSDYIDEHQAKKEAEQYLGYSVEVAKKIDFDPGALDKVWIKNCVAIGLSASFVEPLEASSIGTSIQQAFLLMYRIINYDQKVIDSYNRDCNSILENIRDFVALHYYTNKSSSQFWKDLKNIPVPDKLQERLEIWKHRLPVSEDFNSDSRYILFSEDHHIMVLHGIGHFNTDSIKNEFEMQPIELKIQSDKIIADNKLQHDTVARMSHKEYIKYFR